MIKIQNIALGLDEPEELLKEKSGKILRISPELIKTLKIEKESIDARKKPLKFVYTILLEIEGEKNILRKIKDPQDTLYEASENPAFSRGSEKLMERPVIVGLGPAGLFAGIL